MRGDDLLAEREPEARPPDLAGVRGIGPEELAEDLRLLFGRDAQTRIADLDAREALELCCRDRHDAPAGGVLDGVREEVGDHLPDAIAVSDHCERLLRRVEHEGVTRGLRREELDLVPHEVHERERLERQGEAA